MVPLLVVCAAFLAFSWPPYLSLDPSQTRLPIRPEFPPHFAVLFAHILFGTIALVGSCLQVWPWFRKRYPAAHRRIGRLYVFAGVLPSGVLAVVVSVVSLQGVTGRIGNTLLSLLWLAVTIAGWRMARKRRYAEHRRWMIRSFALTWSIVVNRLWIAIIAISLAPLADTYYEGDEAMMNLAVAESSIWLSWVVNLLIAEWWLERDHRPKKRTPSSRKPAHPGQERPPTVAAQS